MGNCPIVQGDWLYNCKKINAVFTADQAIGHQKFTDTTIEVFGLGHKRQIA